MAVIGQSSFIESQANRGGTVDANTLNAPIGNVALADDGTLFVPDSFNGRVLAYPSVPASDGAAAFVAGKPTLTTPRSNGAGQGFFDLPTAVSIADGKMAVVDATAHRVLIYDEVPSTDGALASFVVGQASFTDAGSRGCFSHALNLPRSAVLTPNGKLVVADTANHRVLIWDTVPDGNGRSADFVLGQSNFTHCTANDADQDFGTDATPDATTLNEPISVWSDGRRLVVADSKNHRVLIWQEMPTVFAENFKAADVVLGQAGFSGQTPNDANRDGLEDGAPSASTLKSPLAVHSDGTRLAVADTGNHRVLLWDSIPTQSDTPPARLFGQGEFNRGQPNDTNQDGSSDPAPSDAVLHTPRGVFIQGSTLFVTDHLNHRVLLFRLD